MSEEYSSKDLQKEDLLRLLACFQSELEARESVIATLKSERSSALDLRAKYGVFNTNYMETSNPTDPFNALHRDTMIGPTVACPDGDSVMKHVYDSQLLQLDNLITSQRHAQSKMREQLTLMEEKYLKVCGKLENQNVQNKHPNAKKDTSSELREQELSGLKSDLESKHVENKCLEKALKRLLVVWRHQRLLLQQQKHAAVGILKERRKLLTQVTSYQRHISDLENILNRDSIDDKALNVQSVGTSMDHGIRAPIESRSDLLLGELTDSNKMCESLQNALAQEVASHVQLQTKFEKLQREYEKLNATVQGITGSEPRGYLATSTSDVAAAPRLKPNPPMRKSSEITNPIPSPTSSAKPLIREESATTEGVSLHMSNTNHISLPSVIASSESRSSTPSPPPPPPVQLHYPYPSVQSNHTASCRTASCGPLSCNPSSATVSSSTGMSRPVSGPPIHPMNPHTMKTRSLLVYQPSTSPYPYQTGPSVQLGRRQQQQAVSLSRGSFQRRGLTIIDPSVGHSVDYPYSIPHSCVNASSHLAKQTCQSRVTSRSGNAPLCSNTSGQLFPTFVPCRPQLPNASGLRAVRTSVTPTVTSGVLSGATSSMGTGHVCINGK